MHASFGSASSMRFLPELISPPLVTAHHADCSLDVQDQRRA